MSADTDSLLAPNDDKEFEQLCQHVLEHRFKTLYGQAYARSGCAQHGVDFYIERPAEGGIKGPAGAEIIGVQCKHKDLALGHELTVEELNAEVEKAKAFRPPLTAFIVATSAPTTKAVQDRANELATSHAREVPPLFPVTAWFWEKIRHEFAKDEKLLTEILQRFYPHFRPAFTSPFSSPHQLTPPVSDFTGRETKLDELRRKVKQGGVAITGVRGMGGVGKTELARRLAAELKADYSDAQIELDLKGVDSQPLSPADVLSAVLRVFLPTAKLPEHIEELGALLRHTIEGKRTLLLLDNAKDARQIGPLLPLPPGCLVFVTSRQHFALPGLDAVNLGVMEPPEARALLLKIAPRIGAQADALAEACGGLPLALRLAASLLAVSEQLDPTEYVQELRESRQRLQMIDKARECTAEALGLEASFTLSFQQLLPEQQRLFSQLAVLTASFNRAAVTAVWAVEKPAPDEALDRLLRLSLLEWNKETQRFELHDLLHEFARNHTKPEELEAAKRRHAEYFIRVGETALKLFLRGGENVLCGMALFDRERAHLETAFYWLESRSDKESAPLLISLVDAMAHTSDLRFHPRQRIRWLEAQAKAARLVGDRGMEGGALGNLGGAYFTLGNSRKAIEFYEQALVIGREVGDRRGEGNALGNLGSAYLALGDSRKAIEFYEQGLVIDREVGDRREEGQDLGNLGNAYATLGDAPEAIGFYEQSLVIARELGDRRGEGNALGNLGSAYLALGDAHKTIKFCQQALVIHRDIGDRRGEGNLLGNLGLAYFTLGDPREAIKIYEQRLVISREIGDQRGEGTSVANLGNAYFALGDPCKASEFQNQALAIHRKIGDRRAEGQILANLGISHAALGEPRKAIAFHEQALVIHRDIGDRRGQGTALGSLGNAYLALGDPHKAIELYEQALAIDREIGDRHGEGTTLWNSALALHKLGDGAQAIARAEAALGIFEAIEDRNAAKVRARLTEWHKAPPAS